MTVATPVPALEFSNAMRKAELADCTVPVMAPAGSAVPTLTEY
jgi:hypothetical protein